MVSFFITFAHVYNPIVCRSEDPGFFEGLFLAKDSDVSTFVEEVRGVVQSVSFIQLMKSVDSPAIYSLESTPNVFQLCTLVDCRQSHVWGFPLESCTRDGE